MIAPAPPSDLCPIDALDGVVEFRVDPNTQPGNVVSALARLLIDLVRRQNERKTTDDTCKSNSGKVS